MQQARKPPRRATPAGAHAGEDVIETAVADLGAQGDGLAQHRGAPLYLPLALAGERVRARVTGRRGDGWSGVVTDVLAPAPDRRPPWCRHFATCGGCAVQHLAEPAALAWKRSVVTAALAHRGLVPPDTIVAPVIAIPPGRRRRATVAFVRRGTGCVLGFNARQSHHVIDLTECPAVRPEIAALLPPLRGLMTALTPAGSQGEVSITLTDTGLDVVLAGVATPGLAGLERLAAFADTHDLARLSLRHDESTRPGRAAQGRTAQGRAGQDRTGQGRTWTEPVATRRSPRALFAEVAVDLPPEVFLQPSREGEAVIVAHIVQAMAGAGPSAGRRLAVADLFAGVGSLTFPLTACLGPHRDGADPGQPANSPPGEVTVHAVDGAEGAINALAAAARRAGLTRLTTEVRDLADRPLAGAELARYAAVVFDPPRAGALAQAQALARSGPPLVVAVSCNPATFARDVRVLVDGGYRLGPVTPIDQFPASPHVELVATLTRPAAGPGTGASPAGSGRFL